MKKNLFKSIVLSIIFLIAGNVNAQQWFCDGTNVVSAMGNFEFDTALYAPNWGTSEDYTASYAEGVFSVSFSHATTDKWQSQFFFDATTLQNLGDAGAEKVYFYSYDIETDVKIGTLTLQFKKADDGTICLAADVVDLPAGTHTISGLTTVPAGVHPFQRLLFDFAWTDSCNIKISNFTLCDGYKGIDMGSIMGNAVPMYGLRDGKPTDSVEANASTLDFKVVTVGQKTWAWTNLTGRTILGDPWASQYRYYTDSGNSGGDLKWTENQLTGRVAGTQQTYGSTTVVPFDNPGIITFFQGTQDYVFLETADFSYDYTKNNSADAEDVTAPALATPEVLNQTSSAVTLALSATDASTNLYYYIEDLNNDLLEIFFWDTVTFALKDSTDYNLKVYAIDFSGNRSEVKNVTLYSEEPVFVTEGIANNNSFKLDSRSLTELVIEGTSTDELGFGDAYAKISIDGAWVGDGSVKEWKPAGLDQTNGTPVYVLQIPASEIPGWEEGKILTLDLGYIIAPTGDWTHYVSPNLNITEGENAGKPILHEIGTGVDIEIPIDTTAIEGVASYSQFKVYCTNGVLSAKGNTLPANMTLYNVAGQKVLEVKNTNSANVTNLRKGAYILKIRTNSGAVEVHKIVL
ncbi:MAG: T9SS type A sorting domain-containing protein [Bacteroidales bacterium]|jgi:hypothetical protein|nr:T9SS type A sorting domain-containing protein [Bacteroidales bacterium]